MDAPRFAPSDLFVGLFCVVALVSGVALSCGPSSPETQVPVVIEGRDDGSRPEDEEDGAVNVERGADAALDEPPGAGDADEEDDQGGGSSAPPECFDDEDCQDGVFCNGFEQCGPQQRCVPGRPIECPAYLPICEESMDTCVCTPGSCPSSMMCDGFTCL